MSDNEVLTWLNVWCHITTVQTFLLQNYLAQVCLRSFAILHYIFYAFLYKTALIHIREIFLMFSYLVSLHNARGHLMCCHLQYCFKNYSRQRKKSTQDLISSSLHTQLNKKLKYYEKLFLLNNNINIQYLTQMYLYLWKRTTNFHCKWSMFVTSVNASFVWS